MAAVTIRELQDNCGGVIDRVEAGETLVVTRDGQPVAELRPLDRQPLDVATIRIRHANLPAVDPDALRADVDAAIDTSW
ncbi:MAG: type II toxin-antitoxin system Phd/YefM family antitoxin [Acidimicrobiales bacterium]